MAEEIRVASTSLESIAMRRQMYFRDGDPRSLVQELAAFAVYVSTTTEFSKLTENHYVFRAWGISETSWVEDWLFSIPCGSMPTSTPVMAFAFSKKTVIDCYCLGRRWIIEDGVMISEEEIPSIEGELCINIYY